MECWFGSRTPSPIESVTEIWRIYTAQASMKLDLVSVDAVERQKKETTYGEKFL